MSDTADDEENKEVARREKWLKMMLIIIAAALAATILSLLTQGSDEGSATETGTYDLDDAGLHGLSAALDRPIAIEPPTN